MRRIESQPRADMHIITNHQNVEASSIIESTKTNIVDRSHVSNLTTHLWFMETSVLSFYWSPLIIDRQPYLNQLNKAIPLLNIQSYISSLILLMEKTKIQKQPHKSNSFRVGFPFDPYGNISQKTALNEIHRDRCRDSKNYDVALSSSQAGKRKQLRSA